MSKTAKTGVEPRLRFPEFKKAGGWEIKNLSELFQIGSGKDYKHLNAGDIPVYGSGGYMLSVDQFLYDGESACIGRKGTIDKPVFLTGKFWTVDTLFYTHSFKDCLPKFIFYIFQTIEWLKHNEAGGVPSLSKEIISKIKKSIPPKIAEQKKIVECLSSLDDVITAQGEKVEALKTYKKGLLQQLFPQDGQTTPTLRFPEFKNAGDWERKPLNKLLYEAKQRNRDLKYGKEHVLSVSGELGCVNQIELLGRSYAGVSVHNYHVVETGDIVYTKSPLKRNPYGIIKENKGVAGIVSTLYAVYRPSDQCHSAFLDYFFSDDFHLNSYLQPLVKKGAKNDMKVNNAYVLTGDVPVPPTVKEQKKISDFLAALDNLIMTETNLWNSLKAHKKGLLQQLFPIIESEGE